MAHRGWSLLAALLLGACSMGRGAGERVLQEGDCASVPDIEHLAITISDHGAKVTFQWSGTGFAGMVQTSAVPLTRDASYGSNGIGEWESRFPGISATETVPGAYLGFPAASDPRAGIFAARVYETRHPAADQGNRAVAVVNLTTNDTVLLAAPRRVGSLALSPGSQYVAIVEIAPATTTTGWRDLMGMQQSAQSPRFDLYATVYATTGLAACARPLATALPSPVVNIAWR